MSTRFVVVDNTDSIIKYGPDWVQQQASLDSIGTFGPTFRQTLHRTNVNTTFTTSFTGEVVQSILILFLICHPVAPGTSLLVAGSVSIKRVNGVADPQWECYVDKILIPGEDVNVGVQENNWPLCRQNTLTDATHELTLKVITQGTTFMFDDYQFAPSPSMKLDNSLVKIDDKDPDIVLEGFQQFSTFVKLTQNTGATMKFNFIGKSVSWYGFIPSQLPGNATWATYSIDGGNPVTFRLNGLPLANSNSMGNQIFFSTPDLEPGPHSLLVTHQGDETTTPLTLDYLIVANATSSSSTPSSSKASAPIGAIVGGVIGGIAFIAVIVMFFLWRRRQNRNHSPREHTLDLTGGEKPRPVSPSNMGEVTPFVSPNQSGPGSVFTAGFGQPPSSYATSAPSTSPSDYSGTGNLTSIYGGDLRLHRPLSLTSSAPSIAPASTRAARKQQEAAASSSQSSGPDRMSGNTNSSRPSRVVHHEDSGIRMPVAEEEVVVEVPPSYTPA
ncbi:hypothetical protein B0H34DRAFT_264925 [Crassisporium funariophilum]|nr:hypothetical protein B0H34DRAFT_264925 [Crassisporium funariophilum]